MSPERDAGTRPAGEEVSFDERIAEVDDLLRRVLGDEAGRSERHDAAQRLGESAATTLGMAHTQLVYGELDVRSVARILDAVDVRVGDRFLDIGSGDGLPTFAAALLCPGAFRVCRGVEVVPALAVRAQEHLDRLRGLLSEEGRPDAAPIELFEGDVYDAAGQPDSAVASALRDTTLALCFATTWSHAPRRVLPDLSATLAVTVPAEARVVLVDARLVESDGWRWEGDLRITTPDTAPFSTARLYTRLA